MLQPKLLEYLLNLLFINHIDYMVTGSIVSSIQGEPRSTHDIDIVVNLQPSAITALIEAFQPPQYYISELSINDALIHKSMFQLLDTTNGLKFDFWILTEEPFDQSRFERKYETNIFGFKMKVSQPEDTILAKLKWAKLSGGSEKQFTDALRVFEIKYRKLDLPYIEKWAQKLQVTELWKQLKEEADPIV